MSDVQYTCEVTIAVPRGRVIELMTDGDRAHEWMAGLASYEAAEGERGQAGSTSELRFQGVPGADRMAMVEKVVRRDDEHYDTVHLLGPVRNEANSTFVDVDGGTLWIAEHTFLMPPGMEEGMGDQGAAAFRANTQNSMEAFKAWCEANA